MQIYSASVDYSCTFAVIQNLNGSQTVVGWGQNQVGQLMGAGDEKIFTPTNVLKCMSGTISDGVISPCGEYLDSGASCTPTCNPGYTISGSRSCSAGTLTDTAVCSANSCDAAGGIANGVPGSGCTSSLAHGLSCTPTCNPGYTISGSRSCSTGTLTDTAQCDPNPCTDSRHDETKNGDDGILYCINDGTVSGLTGSCICNCRAGFGGPSCETAGACSASEDPDKDGSDGTFYCINGGTVNGTAGSC